MGWGTGNIGSGSGGLNFKVVGGTSQPASPKGNTIWVNTDVKITSWIFSHTEPETPSEGIVWIYTGTSSPVEFNALKKNGIQVYPISAKQYVDGAFVHKTAMSYQGRKWEEWITYLYDKGNECVDITGGWRILKSCDGTITKNGTSVTFDIKGKHATQTYGVISTTNPVDLTHILTLRINPDWLVSAAGTGTATRFGVSKKDPNSFSEVTSPAEWTTGGESLDVSTLDGKYYVFVGASFQGASAYTAKIRLTEVSATK